jgi:glycosyltransferase involved in cell wall biosynthesis
VKVLLLHQHFKTPYTGGAIRSYYLARALADQGITPIVITARKAEAYQVENIDGIEVHYLPIAYDNSFGFYERSQAFLHFVWSAVKLSGKFKDADVCYAISVPLTVGIAARRIKSKYKIPYIFEVGDLWPDAPVQLGFIRNKFFRSYLYKLERKVYQFSNALVALSPGIKSAIETKIPGKRVHLLPNFSDTDFFKPEKKDQELESRFGVKDKFVVSYIGAVGLANGLDHFLACAFESQQSSLPVHFILCGEGGFLDHLERVYSHYKLSNFTFIPFQNREGVRQILNVTDAAFVSYLPEPILETGSPNKYFDGLAAGKLIIVNFGGWIRQEIEQNQCGIYVDSKNPADFTAKIQRFVEDNSILEKFKSASRRLALRSYSRSDLGLQFVEIIRNFRLK